MKSNRNALGAITVAAVHLGKYLGAQGVTPTFNVRLGSNKRGKTRPINNRQWDSLFDVLSFELTSCSSWRWSWVTDRFGRGPDWRWTSVGNVSDRSTGP